VTTTVLIKMNSEVTWSIGEDASVGLSSVRVLSAVDNVTAGVTSDAVADCVRTSFICRTTAGPATLGTLTCDPVLLAVTADCFEPTLVDSSALSLSMLAASFFTVCQQTTHL